MSLLRRLVPLVFLVFPAVSGPALDFWDKTPDDLLATALVAAMSPGELASQVIMVAFPEPQPDAAIRQWAAEMGLGGIKFFGWNAASPESVATAVVTLQAESQRTRWRIPLLVATDQEGGWVRHIKGATSTSPGNLALGASRLPWDAWRTGQLLGTELREMGVNMNFAPSVDLYTNPDSTVIGPRSFSADPLEAGVLGAAFFRGLASVGVIATAKHFPGHGNTADDSHGKLPVLQDTLEVLTKRELVPYRLLIAEGLPAIMSGHLAFPKISGNDLPASLSPQLIEGLLRRDLGFRGVVITDDLLMEGARPGDLSISQAALQALMAGNDLLLISKPLSAQLEARHLLVATAASNPAVMDRLRESARRVLLLKLRQLKGPKAVPLNPTPAKLQLPTAGAAEYFLQSTARAATLLAGKDLPWSTAGPLLVVTPYEGALPALGLRFPAARALPYEYRFTGFDPDFRAALVARAPSEGRLVFVLAVPGAMAYLKALEPWKEKLAVISLLSPVYLREVPWVRNAVAVYGTNAAAFEVAAAVLAGDFAPRGVLPLKLSPVAEVP
ncbi:MAG: glycoside hydrolase family 3 protein [Spirochaetales bacterium]